MLIPGAYESDPFSPIIGFHMCVFFSNNGNNNNNCNNVSFFFGLACVTSFQYDSSIYSPYRVTVCID